MLSPSAIFTTMSPIVEIDHSLFYMINNQWSNGLFDAVMPVLRNRYTWFPLYILIVSYLWNAFGGMKGTVLIISLISCVVLADMVSSQLIKKSIRRTRPCNEYVLQQNVIERSTCRYSYSFPSSHATNHFAIASFLILAGGLGFVNRSLMWLWAGTIGFAQIYVGLHFPLDVIAGSLLGVITARLFYALLQLLKIL